MAIRKRKREKPRNPRPKIDYPPVPTRTWVPPYLRPKRKRKPKYIKPPGITQKLAISNLGKVWHAFKILDGRTILTGHFSQTHKRFRVRSNGYQGPCNCIIAIVYSKYHPVSGWNKATIDYLLDLGDELYMHCLHHQDNRNKTCFTLAELYPTFFFEDKKISISVKGVEYTGKLFYDADDSPYLSNVIQDFFNDGYDTGIIATQGKHIAFWFEENTYFLFDPGEHTPKGYPWKGVGGLGYAMVMRFRSTQLLVDVIHENVNTKTNSTFVITPCIIVRTVKIELVPPENVVKPHCTDFKPSEFKIVPAKPPVKQLPEIEEYDEEEITVTEPVKDECGPQAEIEEYSPEVGQASRSPSEYAAAGLQMPEVFPRMKISISMIPIERAKAESVTYFTSLVPDKIGILRASTHQSDSRVTNLKGQQSIANAFAALTMLRVNKSKNWIKRMLDDILKLGVTIHNESVGQLPSGQEIKVTTMCKQIKLEDRVFTPDVDEFGVVGALQSQKDEVLDLLPALQAFFSENQTCVITGPLTLAIWIEDGLFYMFDPNERDKKGLMIIKSIQIGSELKVLDYLPGVACVTWYTDLKDLVNAYMTNVEKTKKRDHFILSKVNINDFIPVPADWYNFKGISCGKWILMGTLSQNDRRFDKEIRGIQCTCVSVMALAYSQLKHVKQWKTEDIDQILLKGTDLYQASVDELKETNRFYNPMLLVVEVKKQFPALGAEIVLDVTDCIVNGLIDAKDENDALNLKKGLHEFFKENDTGIVSIRDISIAVWKTDEIYYYYDSHSRDEKGIANNFGTACLLRSLSIENLAKAIEANLNASANSAYNISRVAITPWESDGGVIRPPLNNFTELNEYSAILRSLYSERAPEFKLNAGRQTVPMCLASFGMMTLYPAAIWSRDIIDEVLFVGDKLFIETMKKKVEYLNEDEDVDEVYAETCLKDFDIGVNKFSLSYSNPIEGTFDYDFEPLMESFLETVAEGDKKEALITSELYTVSTWVDCGLYYLFDPKPRDDTGQVYGKDEWSAKIVPEEGEDYNEFVKMLELGPGGDNAAGPQRRSIGSQASEDAEGAGLKHSERYWRKQEESGRACTMWFTSKQKLIQHIMENIPPNKREYVNFQIFPVVVDTKTAVKQVYDPLDPSTRIDYYSGDWYYFKEVDHGRWILRGTMDCTHVMFPGHNRGKQSIAMCYAALGYAKRFALSKFKNVTVDDILKYGDRLYTATRRRLHKEIQKNKDLPLSTVEIENLLNSKTYGVEDIVRTFCIGVDQIHIEINPETITGDVKSKDVEGVYDVLQGLETYFLENTFGILTCKNLNVAIWRGIRVFFMFDPNSRGPSGVECVNGEACITRYLDLGVLTNVILKNLIKDGKNAFAIHRVDVRIDACPRPPKPDEKQRPEGPSFNGYSMVMPGKSVLRGTLNQGDPKFGRGENAQCASIAVIALSMTLIHKASSWTKPFVDEILILGDELYIATLDTLGFEYNPWEQGLDLHLVNKDYKVGTLKANYEIRTTDQRGIIDIKHPAIQNLRQGIERFFEENTHGVIETETLTVAIWEEDEQPGIIYMFDPNPRGPAGLFVPGGTACVISFETAKMAADHFIANVTDKSKRTSEFVITPVEIVVGCLKTKPKKQKEPCPKRAGELMQPSPTPCEKKRLRKMAELERKKKEAHRISKLGKFEFHPLSNGDAILRGSKSQTWSGYSENSKGNQDLPNCFAAFVVNRLVPILAWHCKHIDMVLDVGDQLYKDSYITYNPKDPKLGLTNILRRIYIKEVRISLKVYKPVMTNTLTQFNLEMALLNYFQQENFCILSAHDEHFAIFFKEGLYYLFDPHDRDVEGNKCGSGTACLLRFQTLPNLVSKFISNIANVFETMGFFTVTLVTIGNIVKENEISSAGGSRRKSK